MNKKFRLDRLFLIFVPALVLIILLVSAFVAYGVANKNEKSDTEEYFSTLAASCADKADSVTRKMKNDAAYAGTLISTSRLAADAMGNCFAVVLEDSAAESGMVVAGGMMVYGSDVSLYSDFSEFITGINAANDCAISPVVRCEDGQYRFASAASTLMDYGARVTVLLIYRASALGEIIDVPMLQNYGKLHIISADGSFLTDGAATEKLPGDEQGRLSQALMKRSDGGLAEYKAISDNKKHYAYSSNLGINGWRLLCEIPVSSVRQSVSDSVGVFFRLTLIALVVLFGAFLYYYYVTNRNYRNQILDRKKFAIAARQSARAVFEYDTIKDKFFLISDCEKITLPGEVNVLTKSMGLSYVYPDDVDELRGMFHELRERPTATCTVRACYFCGENSYHWYYVTATRLASKGLGSTVIIGIVEDIDEREKERISLLQKATTDSLTGLYNRAETARLVNERLASPVPGCTSAFIIFDLDDFKGINDNNGHEIGDKALKFFADKLKSTFRNQDILGRLGGDEFVVFISFKSDEEFVQRRFASFADSITWHRSGDEDLPFISCSAGYVTAMEGDVFETVYRRADRALYRAKTIGKNCAVCGDI